jgi:Skp family chaperone for outer membrane proteins
MYIKCAGAAVALALAFNAPAAVAQQGQSTQWFVPGQVKPAGAPPAQHPAQHSSGSPAAGMPIGGGEAEPSGNTAPLQVQLPPAPEIPPIPKGQATPAAIVGILSVPDVLRVSTAYQAAYKELNARGQKLNEDAQKEQAKLRELGQTFAAERAKLSPEQIRAKETEIQDRATEAQRKFGERNRIIQEAGQYVMMQINRTMEQVAQQVALSRGVNLVLNRAQILGTTADFDLTPAVVEVLNKVLPNVVVPPDGVSPTAMKPPAASAAAPVKPAAASAKQPAQKP